MRARIGIALGDGVLQGGVGAEWPLPPIRDPDWAARLAEAFAALKQAGGVEAADVSVAVLPPICRAREIALPPLGLDQCRRVITRDARRYFTGSAPMLVAVRRLRSSRVLAVAIPESVYDALREAAAGVGWRLAMVGPAQETWWGVSRGGAEKDVSRGAAELQVEVGEETHLLECTRRGWRPLRRLRRGAGPADPSPARRHLPFPGALDLAAQHAHRVGGMAFLPEAQRLTASRRAGRLVRRLLAAAAVLLALAGATSYADLRLELGAVRARRAERKARVDSVLAIEARIARLDQTAAALTEEPRQAGWGELLTEVAMHLPEDAYLTAFGGEADSVALAGIAEDAGGVLETLRRAPSLRGVRLEAPIRQEVRPGEAPIERFVVAARLVQSSRAGANRGGER